MHLPASPCISPHLPTSRHISLLFGSEAGACKAALSMPLCSKADEAGLDASKTGEAFDPRTLDLKARDRPQP